MQLVAKSIQTKFKGCPEVTSVKYDLLSLEIELSFDNEKEIQIRFPSINGFRVLDEGDLLEFWPECSSKTSWLHIVESGGWHTLESTREGYLSKENREITEYLVAGLNDCVSVIAFEEPKITEKAI